MSTQKVSFNEFITSTFLSLVLVSLPFEIIQQFLYRAASSLDDKTIYGVLGFVLSFTENILVLLALGFGLKRVLFPRLTYPEHVFRFTKPLIIEILRGLGKIAVGLLLIIPGCKRMVYYYFIPYVVQFDERYEKGELDVLVECENLLKNRLWRFSMILIFTQIVSFSVELAAMKFNLFTNPLAWVLMFVLGLLVESYIFLYFYGYYLNLLNLSEKEGK